MFRVFSAGAAMSLVTTGLSKFQFASMAFPYCEHVFLCGLRVWRSCLFRQSTAVRVAAVVAKVPGALFVNII